MSKVRRQVLRDIKHNWFSQLLNDDSGKVGESDDETDEEEEDSDDEDDEEDEEEELTSAEHKKLVKRANEQAKKERKGKAKFKKASIESAAELKKEKAQVKKMLDHYGFNSVEEMLEAEDDDDGDDATTEGSDDSQKKKKRLQADKRYKRKEAKLQKEIDELGEYKTKSATLQKRLDDKEINSAIRKVAAAKEVLPAHIDRFVKNIRLDYPEFVVTEDGDVEYPSDDERFETVSEVVDDFLDTDDGQIFLPAAVRQGFGTKKGGKGGKKGTHTRESFDHAKAMKNPKFMDELTINK